MSNGRILVVDDEQSTRSILDDYFTHLGYEVVTVSDGAEAIMKFSPGKFDCIVSDLLMPNMDGLALLKNIKHQDDKVPFLMITGYPSIDRAVDAMKEGAYDYVAKPFHMEDLRLKIERMLDTGRAKKSLKKMTGLSWALIISIPVWLILGIIMGVVWK